MMMKVTNVLAYTVRILVAAVYVPLRQAALFSAEHAARDHATLESDVVHIAHVLPTLRCNSLGLVCVQYKSLDATMAIKPTWRSYLICSLRHKYAVLSSPDNISRNFELSWRHTGVKADRGTPLRTGQAGAPLFLWPVGPS